MYRRRTVEALLRHHERERHTLLGIIREQNDRLMILAGRQYAPTPLETHLELRELEEEPEPSYADVGQFPDDLGLEPY